MRRSPGWWNEFEDHSVAADHSIIESAAPGCRPVECAGSIHDETSLRKCPVRACKSVKDGFHPFGLCKSGRRQLVQDPAADVVIGPVGAVAGSACAGDPIHSTVVVQEKLAFGHLAVN